MKQNHSKKSKASDLLERLIQAAPQGLPFVGPFVAEIVEILIEMYHERGDAQGDEVQKIKKELGKIGTLEISDQSIESLTTRILDSIHKVCPTANLDDVFAPIEAMGKDVQEVNQLLNNLQKEEQDQTKILKELLDKMISQEHFSTKESTITGNMCIPVLYCATENDFFSAVLNIQVKSKSGMRGALAIIGDSCTIKFVKNIYNAVDNVLILLGLKGLGYFDFSLDKSASKYFRICGCDNLDIEIQMASIEEKMFNYNMIQTVISLALISIIKAYKLQEQVACIFFSNSAVCYSDEAQHVVGEFLNKHRVQYTLTNVSIRSVPDFITRKTLWIGVSTPKTVFDFLIWQKYFPVFRPYLEDLSLEANWREVSKLYTALQVRGGRANILMVSPNWDDPQLSESHVITLDQMIEEIPHVVLLGDPGSGKSWTLITYTYKLVSWFLGKGKELVEAHSAKSPVLTILKFPIYINLRTCAESTSFQGMVEDILKSYLNKNALFIEELLSSGCFIFLIDSINELPAKIYDPVLKQITEFRSRYSRNRFIFAHRRWNFSARSLGIGDIYRILPLDEPQKKTLLLRYFEGQRTKKEIEHLFAQVQGSPALKELSTNPLNLALIGERYARGEPLPENKRELLWNFLIDKYAWGERIFEDFQVVMNLISRLAFDMIDTQGGATVIEKEKAISILKDEVDKLFPEGMPHLVIEKARVKGFSKIEIIYQELLDKEIVREEEKRDKKTGARFKVVSFLHHTCQEFLAGRYFVEKYRDNLSDALGQRLVSMGWDEAVILLVPYLSPQDMRKVFKILVNIDMHLAVRCYLKARKEYVAPDAETVLIKEMGAIAQNSKEIPRKRLLAIEALVQMKSRQSFEILKSICMQMTHELLPDVANICLACEPLAIRDELITVACQNVSSEHLGIATVRLLQADASIGVKIICRFISKLDYVALDHVLTYLLEHRSDLLSDKSLLSELSKWLADIVEQKIGKVSVSAAHLLSQLNEHHRHNPSLEVLAEELSADKERCVIAIKTVKTLRIRELFLHILDVFSSGEHEVRTAALDALFALAFECTQSKSLDRIPSEHELMDCLSIIAACRNLKDLADSESEEDVVNTCEDTEKLMEILVQDKGRRGLSAALSLSRYVKHVGQLEQELLHLARSLDKGVAARSVLVLSDSENTEVITVLFNMLSEMEASSSSSFCTLEANQTFLHELLDTLICYLDKHPRNVGLGLAAAFKEKLLGITPTTIPFAPMREAFVNLLRIVHQFRIHYDGFDYLLQEYLRQFSDGLFLRLSEIEDVFLLLFNSAHNYDRDVAFATICSLNPEHKFNLRNVFNPVDLKLHFSKCETANDYINLIRIVGILGYDEFLPKLHTLCEADTDCLHIVVSNPRFMLPYEVAMEAILYSLGLFKRKDSIAHLGKAWAQANKKIKYEIASTMQSIGPDTSSKVVYESMLSSATKETASIIASLLGEVGDKDSGFFLHKMKNNKQNPMYLRNAAYEALRAIEIRLRYRFDIEVDSS